MLALLGFTLYSKYLMLVACLFRWVSPLDLWNDTACAAGLLWLDLYTLFIVLPCFDSVLRFVFDFVFCFIFYSVFCLKVYPMLWLVFGSRLCCMLWSVL